MLALQLALLLTLPNLLTVIFVWFIGYGILLPNTIASAMSVRPDIAGAGAALLGFSKSLPERLVVRPPPFLSAPAGSPVSWLPLPSSISCFTQQLR